MPSPLMNVNQEGNLGVMNNLTKRFKGLFVNDGSMNVDSEQKTNNGSGSMNVNMEGNYPKNMNINGGRRRNRKSRKQRKSRKNRKNQRKSRRN